MFARVRACSYGYLEKNCNKEQVAAEQVVAALAEHHEQPQPEEIRAHELHVRLGAAGAGHSVCKVKATGGGAYKFAKLFEEELGVVFDKEDEMGCIIGGANYLLRSIRDEACVAPEPSPLSEPPFQRPQTRL